MERAGQIAQRWIIARLRNRTFFALAELNDAIAEACAELNARTMKTYGASRRALFERLDVPALRPLPATRFALADWKAVTADIDYHVEFDGHYYSVPYTPRGLRRDEGKLEVRATQMTVEVFHGRQRVASHLRSNQKGRHTTCADHMPSAHRAQAEWSPSRLIGWAQSIGASTGKLVEAILAERPHPEQGYRSCLGILRLSKVYGAERLEAACARAVLASARSYRHVDSILRHGLDRLTQDSTTTTADAVVHGNIRGPGYYH